MRSLILLALLVANILVLAVNRDHPWESVQGSSDCRKDYDPFTSTCRAVSPRNGIVVKGTEEGVVLARNTQTNELIQRLMGTSDRKCLGLLFSPDGRRLISVHDCETMMLWDTETWKRLRFLGSKPLAADWSGRDGGLLVLSDGSVLSLSEGAQIARLKGSENAIAHHACFSPDGEFLLLVRYHTVTIYKTADWSHGGELRIPGKAMHDAYFGSGGLIITESREDIAYKTANGPRFPPCSTTRWRRIAPWGWDSEWYRPEVWTLILLAPALLISLCLDVRDLQKR